MSRSLWGRTVIASDLPQRETAECSNSHNYSVAKRKRKTQLKLLVVKQQFAAVVNVL